MIYDTYCTINIVMMHVLCNAIGDGSIFCQAGSQKDGVLLPESLEGSGASAGFRIKFGLQERPPQ
jgi:hypothetical protein